ncbi:MAG: AAA family ATPase [Pseudanabaena sp.]
MLKHISIKGYKSIKELDLDLSPINVLIGANGSGKSNFISFFKLLHWMMRSPGQLQLFVGQSDGANSLLFDGAAVTSQIEAELNFESKNLNLGYTPNLDYIFNLSYAATDTFVFGRELYAWNDPDQGNIFDLLTEDEFTDLKFKNRYGVSSYESGYKESRLINDSENKTITEEIYSSIQNIATYQFHDTSRTARFKQKWDIDDNQFLKEDAGNLAPFLLRLKENEPRYYQRIVETLRQIVPFFADFVFSPIRNSVILQWQELGTDLVFSPHQASDGTLRAIALVTLLLQPPESLPDVLILDEPELGLHPYAINIIGSLINSVSNCCQVILATQSPLLVDCFEPEDIIIVERNERESTFKRLVETDLEDWLEEYSLSELWNKNVIGGRPS